MMPNLLPLPRAESPTPPALQNANSSSSQSSSSRADSPPLQHGPPPRRFHRQVDHFDTEDDPVMCGRSEVGVSTLNDGWSTREQEHFIELILPHINGKCLTEEEIQLIRAEAEQAHLPPECVDRLLDQKRANDPIKHQCSDFETIEDVDESDNILAYFSRMNTLKQGGHFPRLNTDALSDFVEQESTFTNESIEVDLDVGYVNTTFNLDHSAILHEESSWVDSDNDDPLGYSLSSAVEGHTNRYAPYQKPNSKPKREKDAFASLLVGYKSGEPDPDESTEPQGRTRYDVDFNEPMPSMEETSTSHTEVQTENSDWAASKSEDNSDWAPPTPKRRTYRYGYERDLEEWRKKRDMALWQPQEGSKGASSLFSCQAMAESVVAEELNGLLWGASQRPPRLRGITAVRKLVQETGQRKKLQQERNQLRHVPIQHGRAPRPWQLTYRERCKEFKGYTGIDQYSLMQTAAAIRPMSNRDKTNWEQRDVRQHFLHDQSIGLSRNWFGRLRKKNGNDLVRYRPCRPPTMGMPANTCSYESDDDWSDGPSRTTASKSWKSSKDNKKLNKTASMSFTSGDDEEASDCHSDEDSTGKASRENDGLMELDFGSMISSMMTGANDTFTSYSKLRRHDYGMAWMSEDEDDIESVGVSAILDADSGDDQLSKPSSGKPSASVAIESVTETDRYVSSFSESSTNSDDISTTSNPLSESSSGSYLTGDSESTSSYSSMEAPECGTLVNVKSKLGERVSRVTPNHTSHLLRSRFRKKYLRHAPFDKYMS